MNRSLQGELTARSFSGRRRRRPAIASLVAGVVLAALAGCDTTKSIDTPSEFFVPFAAVGETVESNLLVRHHGRSTLSFAKFEVELSDEYKLDWCIVDSRTGLASGPPRIAGYHEGRVAFPSKLNVPPGRDLLLMLTYTPTADYAPSGRISMESNDPAKPQLELIVRPSPFGGG